MNLRLLLISFCCALALPFGALATAKVQVIYILDASNSMWGRINGVAKIDTAKSVLGDLLAETDEATSVGLLAYGHRDKTSCSDIEVIAPVGARTAALQAAIAGLTPRGKTPISGSLLAAAAAFPDGGAGNNIVLISDGVETCDADPCATSAALAAQDISTKVHVVGFDIRSNERSALECIATNGGGAYVAASSAETLKSAIRDVQKAAVAPLPVVQVAAKAEPVEIFRDDFDGDDLADHWTVSNPNPDGFIVEDGVLLVIAAEPATLTDETVENLLTLDIPAPDGDWEIEVRYDAEFNTQQELVQIGLYDDQDNFIAANSGLGGNSVECYFNTWITKVSRGKIKETTTPVSYWSSCDGEVVPFMGADYNNPRPIVTKLIKEGRTYRSSHRYGDAVDENGEPLVYESATVSSLRPPKQITLAVTQRGATSGETLFYVDSIVIRRRQ